MPVRREVRRATTRGSRPTLNTYGRGPGAARSATASTTPPPPVVVVTMADGSDDPEQIDELARLVERGVVVAAASRYMHGGQQVGGPVLKGAALAARRAVACTGSPGSAPATRPTRSRPTRREFVRDGRHRVATQGFEIGIELVAKARRAPAAGRRAPDHLARPRRRRVELQAGARGSRGTCAGTASPSGPRLDELDAGDAASDHDRERG